MMTDDFDAPKMGSPLSALLVEDIDPLSVDELRARIAALKSEIARAESRIAFAGSHRANADSLFTK